jgi:hypothetical protein
MPKCHTCGRFMRCEPGAAWKMVYTGHPPEPHGEIYQCKACTQKHGAFTPDYRIKPEASCGVYR